MFKKLTILTAAMLLTISVAPVFADENGNELVLTALVKGLANPLPTEDPCILTNTETGTGGLDQNIGKITLDTTEIIDLSSSLDCFNPDSAEVDAKFTLTALANSDKVFGTYQTVILIDPAGDLTALGRYQITGGTGMFEDAKGTGVITAQGNLFAPEVTGQLIGDVSSNGDDD